MRRHFWQNNAITQKYQCLKFQNNRSNTFYIILTNIILLHVLIMNNYRGLIISLSAFVLKTFYTRFTYHVNELVLHFLRIVFLLLRALGTSIVVYHGVTFTYALDEERYYVIKRNTQFRFYKLSIHCTICKAIVLPCNE